MSNAKEVDRLDLTLAILSDGQLRALHRIAKKRARPFFSNPHNMIALRAEIYLRGIKLPSGSTGSKK